jgi:hypothetical protein
MIFHSNLQEVLKSRINQKIIDEGAANSNQTNKEKAPEVEEICIFVEGVVKVRALVARRLKKMPILEVCAAAARRFGRASSTLTRSRVMPALAPHSLRGPRRGGGTIARLRPQLRVPDAISCRNHFPRALLQRQVLAHTQAGRAARGAASLGLPAPLRDDAGRVGGSEASSLQSREVLRCNVYQI